MPLTQPQWNATMHSIVAGSSIPYGHTYRAYDYTDSKSSHELYGSTPPLLKVEDVEMQS